MNARYATHDRYPFPGWPDSCQDCPEMRGNGIAHPNDLPAGATVDDDLDGLADELTAEYIEAIERVRDLAQLARIGGREILAYYRSVTDRGRPWTISLAFDDDAARQAAAGAAYQRNARTSRDVWYAGLARPHWPIMRAAVR